MSGEHRQFTFDDIAAAYVYDPDTGELWRRLPKGALRPLRLVRVLKETDHPDREKYTACRAVFRGHHIVVTHIIWMLMTRRWPDPTKVVDHKDRDVFNCRWSNLREAPPIDSARNREAPGRYASDSGLERGVYPQGNKYQVHLKVEGRLVYYGTFPTKAAANARSRLIRAALHGEFFVEDEPQE